MDQISNITCFGGGGGDIGGDGGSFRCGHDGVDNAKGGGLFLLDRWVLDAIGFKLVDETYVYSGA